MLHTRVEAADLIMVKVVTDNLEGLHNKTEAKDLNMVNASFKVIAIREVHLNKTVLNTATIANPISRETKQIAVEAEAVAVDLSNSEGPIIRNRNGRYQYQYYTHDPQPEQYGPPWSLCGRFNHSPKHCYKGEHDINNIMEKMSINPHQSQQDNLYQ